MPLVHFLITHLLLHAQHDQKIIFNINVPSKNHLTLIGHDRGIDMPLMSKTWFVRKMFTFQPVWAHTIITPSLVSFSFVFRFDIRCNGVLPPCFLHCWWNSVDSLLFVSVNKMHQNQKRKRKPEDSGRRGTCGIRERNCFITNYQLMNRF